MIKDGRHSDHLGTHISDPAVDSIRNIEVHKPMKHGELILLQLNSVLIDRRILALDRLQTSPQIIAQVREGSLIQTLVELLDNSQDATIHLLVELVQTLDEHLMTGFLHPLDCVDVHSVLVADVKVVDRLHLEAKSAVL